MWWMGMSRAVGAATRLLCLLLAIGNSAGATLDYKDALNKAILFYEGQRSGPLDLATLRNTWRSSSALTDGISQGVDLIGGYYDAGDNVKFHFPLAFSMTTLSWSILEYRSELGAAGELNNAIAALRWGTDYLLKCHTSAKEFWAQVGLGADDHACWQRPEDMDTSRTALKIDASHPGSDLAAEAAAAMASASLVFQSSNPAYSSTLLSHAKDLFAFANAHKGAYSESLPDVSEFYKSWSGYKDELAWGAAWLYRATADATYLDYLVNDDAALGLSTNSVTESSWDNKNAGAQILVARVLLLSSSGLSSNAVAYLKRVKQMADSFACAHMPQTRKISTTPQGLIFIRFGVNLQYVVNAIFLASVYADYLQAAGQNLVCGSVTYAPSQMLEFAKGQMDYILGNNAAGMSYMVGFGSKYPLKIHHRGASIVSIRANPAKVDCKGGYATWASSANSNPNVHIGAIVGGPDAQDNYVDERSQHGYGEPTTYNNAAAVGLLAKLYGVHQSKAGSPPSPPGSTPPVQPPRLPETPAASPPPPSPSPSAQGSPPPSASGASQIAITQTPAKHWVDGATGKTIYQFDVVISYSGTGTVSNVLLSIPDFAPYGYWGIQPTSTPGVFSLTWSNTISSASPYSFGYQMYGGKANIRIYSSSAPNSPPSLSSPLTSPPPSSPRTQSPPPSVLPGASQIAITQTPANHWVDGATGKTIYQFDVVISYSGTGTVSNVLLSIPDFAPYGYWGIQPTSTPGVFSLTWSNTISSASPYSFGYQMYGGKGKIQVFSFSSP